MSRPVHGLVAVVEMVVPYGDPQGRHCFCLRLDTVVRHNPALDVPALADINGTEHCH